MTDNNTTTAIPESLLRIHEAYGIPLTMDEAREKLHDDLLPYLEEGEPFTMLRHPLVFAVPFLPCEGAVMQANEQLAQKRRYLRTVKRKKSWSTYVFMHERPYRLNALMNVWNDLDAEASAKLLGEVWIDSENIRQNAETWEHLWEALHARKLTMHTMDEDDRKVFVARLDAAGADNDYNWKRVWRGCNRKRGTRLGLSWTFDRDKAIWFSERLCGEDDEPVLLELIVGDFEREEALLACFEGRGESEAIISPTFLHENEHRIVER